MVAETSDIVIHIPSSVQTEGARCCPDCCHYSAFPDFYTLYAVSVILPLRWVMF